VQDLEIAPDVAAARERRRFKRRAREQPIELGLHLIGQFARRRDDERARPSAPASRTGGFPFPRRGREIPEQRLGDERAKSQRLSRAGLRRHQQIAALHLGFEDRHLHRGCSLVAARGDGFGQRWDKAQLGKCAHRRACYSTLIGRLRIWLQFAMVQPSILQPDMVPTSISAGSDQALLGTQCVRAPASLPTTLIWQLAVKRLSCSRGLLGSSDW
jgi:hypothetical protein